MHLSPVHSVGFSLASSSESEHGSAVCCSFNCFKNRKKQNTHHISSYILYNLISTIASVAISGSSIMTAPPSCDEPVITTDPRCSQRLLGALIHSLAPLQGRQLISASWNLEPTGVKTKNLWPGTATCTCLASLH